MVKHTLATDAIVGVIESKRPLLKEHPLPSPEIVREAIAGCISKTTGQWLRSKPRCGGVAEALWACVRFHGGTKFYRFENVSRRAILSLMVWQDRSLGQWVNRHCLQDHLTYSV